MSILAVIDYHSGNLYSVVKALEQTAPPGVSISLATDARAIERAERIVFPGQGSPGSCMDSLRARGLLEPIRAALREKAFMGICMGMQLMFRRSEEGGIACLDIIGEPIRRLRPAPDFARNFRLPHIGWNQVRFLRTHPLWEGVGDQSWFYFVHSYAWTNTDHPFGLGASWHGQAFVAALAWDNVVCLQFHPEKSARAGLRLLHNFQRWQPGASVGSAAP